MRDPARIDPIVDVIREMWKTQPDTRLCQLLFNAAYRAGWKINDLFHCEDTQLFEGLMRIKRDYDMGQEEKAGA